MHLRETGRGEEPESRVPKTRGELEPARAGREGLVWLAEQHVDIRQERANPDTLAVVVQPIGESRGFAQALQHPAGFTELKQHRPQLEADFEGLLQVRLTLRQR